MRENALRGDRVNVKQQQQQRKKVGGWKKNEENAVNVNWKIINMFENYVRINSWNLDGRWEKNTAGDKNKY